MTDGQVAEWRSRRRAVIRMHHPDAGGDAAELIRQLAAFDAYPADRVPYPEVSFVRSPPWPRRLAGRALRRRRTRPLR